ncbi:MAG: dimethylmenaquinone methyltransferase [Bryobacteraceae bacterium]|jgi:regulator of RNase E activity RraA
MKISISAFAPVCLLTLFVAVDAQGQINNLTREELIKYTAPNPFDRFPDGRPKIPEALLEQFKDMSSEELLGAGQPASESNPRLFGSGPAVTYTDGWQILNPGKKLIGRAFTLQLMPTRLEIFDVEQAEWKQKGNVVSLSHQSALDMLQPGDVIVVDAGGNLDLGGIIGDNLAFYIWTKTGTGFVIDGGVRDLDGIAEFDMPGYFRGAVPGSVARHMTTGINVPVRIGKATVMPGDLVFGDREGVNFIPPQAVQRLVDAAKTTHIHDDWVKSKFKTRQFKSTDVYGSGSLHDPALKKEYDDNMKEQLSKQK